MKKILLFAGLFIIIMVGFITVKKTIFPAEKKKTIPEKPLAKYTYEALHKTTFAGDKIIIDKIVKDEDTYALYIFYFFARGKKISGLMDIPKKTGSYPVIVLIRGYVDPGIYTPGMGTIRDGEYLAQNGFITLAPDFLGYATSDKAPTDPMEDRFMTYVSVLELFSSVKNLNPALTEKSLSVQYDGQHLGVWGHSNGGQIALSVLEISGKTYPTVLWAPVSKPFPYSILYYTDEVNDHGKALRKLVADFEKDYDSEKYSLTNYFDWINASIQLNQGTADEEVPQKWSDDLTDTLKKKGKDVEYFTYPGEDHNFDQGEWSLAIQRTLAFYRKLFGKN